MHIDLNAPELPEARGIAVIGGAALSMAGLLAASQIGAAIIDAGCCLVTGGREGAGRSASAGAASACAIRGVDPEQWVFSLVPVGQTPDFALGTCLEVGRDKLERRIALVQNTWGAIVVGGGPGTRSEIRLTAIAAIMDGYSLIPACGTGGEADRICASLPRFEEPVLNDSRPTVDKAAALVRAVLDLPCWYCDIDLDTV